ncbi:FERM protein [Oesophagostomum dentatum]|uniref:FERM protein n=1 Tax=Oesophagostomum dentatum TaxID=61180 RepID=A0A0B1TCU6_OESDE|nr:FERM protein [Oesophagostomum dentatum]
MNDVTRDWSDHALWWPEKRRWLQHTRSTLDQCGVTADSKLEFTPMHKDARVQLPDNQIIEARLDFSVNAFKATQKLCRDLGIRHSEELGLKRLIPPDILRKGTYEAENSSGPQPIRPGEESVGPMTLRKATPIFASQTQIDGRMRGQSPALSTSGHIFNAHEMGTLPRHGGTLPRGTSPSPGAYNGTMGRVPIMPSISFCEGLENEQFDMALVHTPRQAVNRDTVVFRPQNYVEKAALNRGWLDSSRSLMEQGVFEGDVVLLRFKYMTFFDLNPKYDPVRINQLYEQAKWSILLDEFDHTEEEASLFAALQVDLSISSRSLLSCYLTIPTPSVPIISANNEFFLKNFHLFSS